MPLGIWDVSVAHKTQNLQKIFLLQGQCLGGISLDVSAGLRCVWPMLSAGKGNKWHFQTSQVSTPPFRVAMPAAAAAWYPRLAGEGVQQPVPSSVPCCRLSLPGRSFPGMSLQMPPTAGPAAELPLQSPSHAACPASLLSSALRADRLLCPYSTTWKLVLWIGAIQSKLIHEKFTAILCCSNSDLWLKLFLLLTSTFSSVTLAGKFPAIYTHLFSKG